MALAPAKYSRVTMPLVLCLVAWCGGKGKGWVGRSVGGLVGWLVTHTRTHTHKTQRHGPTHTQPISQPPGGTHAPLRAEAEDDAEAAQEEVGNDDGEEEAHQVAPVVGGLPIDWLVECWLVWGLASFHVRACIQTGEWLARSPDESDRDRSLPSYTPTHPPT